MRFAAMRARPSMRKVVLVRQMRVVQQDFAPSRGFLCQLCHRKSCLGQRTVVRDGRAAACCCSVCGAPPTERG